jgi:hypothetical protein
VILFFALLAAAFIVVTELTGTRTKKGAAAGSPAPSPGALATSHSIVGGKPHSSPKARKALAAITGYGATIAAWNAHHTADHDFAAGTVYDPDPSLPEVNGHTGAVYVLVAPQGGLVLSYAMNLAAGTTLHAAVTTAQAEFPRDARLLWIARKNTCVQVQFASAILGHVLARPAIGDASGQVPNSHPCGFSQLLSKPTTPKCKRTQLGLHTDCARET